jgi:hypothetical protein
MMIRGFGGGKPPTRIGREAGAAKRQRQGNLRFPWSVSLLVAMTGLLGWAAPPKNIPPRPKADTGIEAEDAALISELPVWEERAAAEQYIFLQSLDLMQDLLPAGTPGPETGGE